MDRLIPDACDPGGFIQILKYRIFVVDSGIQKSTTKIRLIGEWSGSGSEESQPDLAPAY